MIFRNTPNLIKIACFSKQADLCNGLILLLGMFFTGLNIMNAGTKKYSVEVVHIGTGLFYASLGSLFFCLVLGLSKVLRESSGEKQ